MSLNATLDPVIRTAAFTAVDATLHIVNTSAGGVAVTAPAGSNQRFLICDVAAGSGNALTLNAVTMRAAGDPSAAGIALYEAHNASGVWAVQTGVYLNPTTRAALGRQLGLATAYTPDLGGGPPPARTMLLYWPSWGGSSTTMGAKIPDHVTHLILSFVKPDLVFDPASPVFELAGPPVTNPTGLQFWDSWSPAQVKASIAAIKTARPGLKIILSLGGGTYNNWSTFAGQGATATAGSVLTDGGPIQAMHGLCVYLGVDGIDVDYEVFNASGTNVMTGPELSTYRNAIKGCRAICDATGGELSVSALHVGFETAASSWWTISGAAGRERNVFADPAIAAMVDLVAIQTYDISLGNWSPMKAYDQLRAFFLPAVICCAGLEGAPEGGGSTAVLVANDADTNSGVAVSWISNDQYGVAVNKPYSAETISTHVAVNGQPQDGVIVWVGLRPGITAIMRASAAGLGMAVDEVVNAE